MDGARGPVVATQTAFPVVVDGLIPSQLAVGVMAGGAGQGATALAEAGRLQHAVAGAVDLETIERGLRVGVAKIEVDDVIREGLPRFEGIDRAARPPEPRRRRRRFQVTLQTDIELPLKAQPGRIDDGLADLSDRSRSARRQLHVIDPRAVATVATDAGGQFRPENVSLTVAIRGLRKQWIAVVTEQTGVGDLAAEVFVVRAVVAGAHPPALNLRIPGHRQLPQHTPLIQAQVAAGMLTRSDDPGHLPFQDVLLVSVGVKPVAPLEEAPLLLHHPVMPIGGSVKEVVLPGVILDHVFGRGPIEGTRHGHFPIAPIDLGMAGLADLGGERGLGGVLAGLGVAGRRP